MGNPAHMEIARKGKRQWNRWRAGNLRVQPDLTRIDLSNRNLAGYDFRGVGLFKANLSGANLRGAILRQAILIKSNLRHADITGAHVYGAAIWDVDLSGAIQTDLVITEPNQPVVTADNLEVAQFLHLLLANEKLRGIIDTLTAKMVLILGRFTAERKKVLERLKVLCRNDGFVPVIFDFEGPANRSITETDRTLAHLSRFVLADISSPKSIPQELQAIVGTLKVPVVPLLAQGQRPWGMFSDLAETPWVIPLQRYRGLQDLPKLFPGLIRAAETKAAELSERRRILANELRK